ncbi:hypothetical protein HD806DRAFT_404227 [Xylariaceae sp. AK1471]|nr:hypothetical protein HD806DRAFT_404227 [Xylariaceae sp. AK1471]
MDQQFEDGAGLAPVHDIDFTLQKYLILYNQHEELCQRLNELCPSSLSSTTTTSPSVSPTRSIISRSSPSRFKFSVSLSREQPRTSHMKMQMPSPGYRIPPSQLEPVLDEALVGEVAAGKQKLFDVNEGIKRALTELLNCEAVRQDKAIRTWVQTRLMETEKELRRGRRRRRSSAAVD